MKSKKPPDKYKCIKVHFSSLLHHSTAITTSENIYKKTQNKEIKKLSKSIIDTQEKEIQLMKSLLK